MNKKGQVTLEAVAILVIFLLAFLCMRNYMKAAIQAHWRSNVDSFSDEQYSRGVSQEQGIDGNPAGAIVYADTSITSNLTGARNLLDRTSGIIQLPRGGSIGSWGS